MIPVKANHGLLATDFGDHQNCFISTEYIIEVSWLKKIVTFLYQKLITPRKGYWQIGPALAGQRKHPDNCGQIVGNAPLTGRYIAAQLPHWFDNEKYILQKSQKWPLYYKS